MPTPEPHAAVMSSQTGTVEPQRATPQRAARWHVLGGLMAVLLTLGVFAMYLRPDFLLTLADQLWSCM